MRVDDWILGDFDTANQFQIVKCLEMGLESRVMRGNGLKIHILPLVGPGVGFRQCKQPKKSNPRAQNSPKITLEISKKTISFSSSNSSSTVDGIN